MSEQDVPEPEPGEDITPEQHAKYHWGAFISETRQAWLRDLADRQREWAAQPEDARGDSVFNGVALAGADVFWLAEASPRNAYGHLPNLRLEGVSLALAHLEEADLSGAHLTGADLTGAHLERAILNRAELSGVELNMANLEGVRLDQGAVLEGAQLGWAKLTGAVLNVAQMTGADLTGAQLDGADLSGAQLDRANLNRAHLEGANLIGTHLNWADLGEAHLEGAHCGLAQFVGADLVAAHLEGADLNRAYLVEARLIGATMDKTTRLAGATVTKASLDQVTFDNVNLTVIDWRSVLLLGDEVKARDTKDATGKPKEAATRRLEFERAVRANRVLAVTLRSQGMNEVADRFAYRAQLLQRQVLRRQRQWGPALGSWLLDAVAGYGYKPFRSVIAYILIIGLFAGAYLLNAQFAAPHLTWDEALVLSISSFHGRGFFTTGISLGDTLARLAAGEAIIGLLIEITFIATFTQRFFAR